MPNPVFTDEESPFDSRRPKPIPDTMRAVLLVGQGGPEMLEVRSDVPVPVPGPGEVLIEVRACGMNNTDINTRVGWYSKSVTGATSGDGFADAGVDGTWGGGGVGYPRIQGADPSGVVAAVGHGVDPALVGGRALIDPWVRDVGDPTNRSKAGYLGSELDGGFAEYMVVPAVNVHVHSATLSDVDLAGFPCSWSTAEHMLQRVSLSEGCSIAVTGASGGVGSALIGLARLRPGVTVTAIAGRSKLDSVAALGCHHLIAREEDDVAGAAVEANGGPFDVVADVVGGDDFGSWLDVLGRGGRYVTAGAIAGPVVDLDLRTLYLNDLELHGATVFMPGIFGDLVGYIERGRVSPVVGASYPLEEIGAAQEAFGQKQHVGAMVLVIDPDRAGEAS